MIERIPNLLRAHGIKPSHHRIKVYEYLVEKRNHPSVDMIYQELVQNIPTLSKTTVYNILNLFLEKGLAVMITIDENETRYDADTSLHGHFRCNNCQGIYDLRLDPAAWEWESLDGFEINESHLYFKGLCPECCH
ncbi:MAG: transcriptional repressor [Syntrophomonadaceae bacterium]|nr:transcriptional repressor [Syntrophomonadaceae bacterium]